MSDASNPLELAAEIRQDIEQADASIRDAVFYAVRAGEGFIEAKEQLKHGEWLPWLEANFPGAVRTAQLYMQVARQREDAQRLAHLGISGCLKELAKRKDLAERTAAAEEKLAQESYRLLGPPKRRQVQLTLLDLDLDPIGRDLVATGWRRSPPPSPTRTVRHPSPGRPQPRRGLYRPPWARRSQH